MRNRTHAFTLVELLVVIGIIALLVGILLPALKGIRNQAKEIKCMSNMRQMAAGMLMYTNDHKGRFPWHDTLQLNYLQHSGYTLKNGFYDVLRKRYITDGWLTICPFYAERDNNLKDPYYYTSTTGNWDWDRFQPAGTAQPTIIVSPYAFLPNVRVVDNSKAVPMTFNKPTFPSGDRPWPITSKDCYTDAPMIIHVVQYSDKTAVDNGHGARAPQVKPTDLPTSYLNLRTRSQPVAYGDGHVELHRNGDIKHRATLTGVNWGAEEIWY